MAIEDPDAIFRSDENVLLRPDNFSVGSTIYFDNPYLIVADLENTVQLLNLKTYQLEPFSVTVRDRNHLSKKEAAELARGLQLTLSDLALDAQGLKLYNYTKEKAKQKL